MTNYEVLFDSPELTAITLHRIMNDDGYARVLGIDGCETVMDLLGWLREEDGDE